MAGFASRWDRYYPKAFEAIANHRFTALGFACETNLLAERGRGTLRRRFAASIASAQWARQEFKTRGTTRVRAASAHRVRITGGTLLACGSSERQLASKGSVDLVLTDPPYFDDVQYAELAGLFLVWAQWGRGWDSNPRRLLTSPLFESDGRDDGAYRRVSAEAVLNTNLRDILLLRVRAWRPGSLSMGPKWRPYRPRLAVTGWAVTGPTVREHRMVSPYLQ
jgi:hypothetical protein